MNISRHAAARRFQAQVDANQRKLTITITDDGRGLGNDPVPPSIQRRAKMLRGKLRIESPVGDTGHGTRITLVMPIRARMPFF